MSATTRPVRRAWLPMALASCLLTVSAQAESPEIGAWGFDTAGKDAAVRPGDDFFRYSGGGWMQREVLPSDRTRWGTFDKLAERASVDTRKIIEDLAANPAAVGSPQRKIGDYYRAFMDTAAIEARGLAPVQPALDEIRGLASHADVARVMYRPDVSVTAPIMGWVSIDQKDPDRHVVVITHAGLGLPEREFYLRDDAQFREIRDQYRTHLARLLELGGVARGAEAAAAAGRILALETEIAKLHWPVAKRRERELTYNPRSRAQLIEMTQGFPLTAALESAGFGKVQEFVVREADAMAPLAALFGRTPVATWREYMVYHYLRSNATVLPQALTTRSSRSTASSSTASRSSGRVGSAESTRWTVRSAKPSVRSMSNAISAPSPRRRCPRSSRTCARPTRSGSARCPG